MKTDNEIIVTINISEALMAKIANIMIVGSSATPMGVILPQAPPQQDTKKEIIPIGFKQ